MTINTHQIQSEVLAAFGELVEASKARDSARYLQSFVREKFTGLSADGTIWQTMEDLEKLIVPGFAMIERLASLEFFKVQVTVVNAATAILVNEFKQSIVLKNGDTVEQAGGGLQVWVQTGDAWKLVSIAASDAGPRHDAVF